MVVALVLGGLLIIVAWSLDALVTPFGLDSGEVFNDYVIQALGGWIALYAIATAVAVWDAVRLVKARDLARLRRAALVVKIVAIPSFVLNFLAAAVIVLAGTLVVGFGPIVAPIFVALTYLVLLPTSIYGFACLILLRRFGTISSTFLTVNVLLHLMFVVDIISTLVVAHRASEVIAANQGAAPAPPGRAQPPCPPATYRPVPR